LFGVRVLYEWYFVHFYGGCHAVEVGLFHYLERKNRNGIVWIWYC
jgi:hypothetical protein